MIDVCEEDDETVMTTNNLRQLLMARQAAVIMDQSSSLEKDDMDLIKGDADKDLTMTSEKDLSFRPKLESMRNSFSIEELIRK